MSLDSAEVVVVGGGIVGVSSAYFLKKKGFDVVLVERHELAHGASGRNPGYLWLHNRNKGIALDLARAGMKIYEDVFIPDLGNSFEYRRNGGMIYFYTEEQKKVFQEFVDSRNADGVEMELLDAETAKKYAPILPDNVLGATYSPEDGQMRTPKLVKALGEACKNMGVRIYEDTSVMKVNVEDDHTKGVLTTKGNIDAGSVVLASGAWTKLLGETVGVDIPVEPERLGVIKTMPLKERVLDKVIYGPLATKTYADFCNLPSYKVDYFTGSHEDAASGVTSLELMAQLQDNSLLLGCPMDYPNSYTMKPSIGGINMAMNAFLEQWPEYKNLEIDDVWAGLLPYTADMLPIVDKVKEYRGMYVACGHVYGNVAGPITGKLISEMVNGEETSLPIDELKMDRESLVNRDKAHATGW